MKRKLFTVLLMILIVCLAGSMLVLAACNKNEEERNYNVKTSTMLNQVIDNMGNSFKIGESFGIDIAANFVVDDKTDANKDVTYKLVAKGNIDFTKADAQENNNFAFEIVQTEGEENKVLVGIAYEIIEGKPYFFINLLDGGYAKINGYSLTAIYNMADTDASASAEGIDIVGTIAGLLFGNYGTVKDGVYTFNFNLEEVLGNLNTVLPAVIGQLKLGITADDIDGIIGALFGDLTYEKAGATVNVTDLATLHEYVKSELAFNGKISFKFDGNNKFVSAKAAFDASSKGTTSGSYALNVEKIMLGSVETAIDTFAGTAVPAEADRKTMEAKNLLNFQMNGVVEGRDADGAAVSKYTISVNSDINPVYLFELIDETNRNQQKIVSILERIGYFDITVNKVNIENDEIIKNILTLHLNGEDGFAILQLLPNPINPGVSLKLPIGGLYDFEALVGAIAYLTEKAPATGDSGEGTDTANESTDIGGILSTVGGIFEFIHTDNISTEGLTIDMADLLNGLLGETGAMLIDILDGNASLNFKLQTPTFGTCDESDKVEAKDIENNVSYNTNKEFVSEIVSLGENVSIPSVIPYGAPIDFTYISGSPRRFNMRAKTIQGTEIDTLGHIVSTSLGKYPKPGTYNDVILYIGIQSDLDTTISTVGKAMGMNIDKSIPLSGTVAYKYPGTITIRELSDEAVISTGWKTTNLNDLHVGDNLSQILGMAMSIAAMPWYINFNVVDGDYSFTNKVIGTFYSIVDENGKDVTSEVVSVYLEGLHARTKLLKTGTYTLRYTYGSLIAEYELVITPGVAKENVLVNSKIDGALALSISSTKVYTAKYIDGKVKLVNEKGEELTGYTLQLTWKTAAKPVEFVNGGYIKIDDYSAPADTCEYKVVYNEFEYTGSLTIKRLGNPYAKKINVGQTIDGAINKASDIQYFVDGELVKLAFKYGNEGYGFYNGDALVYAVEVGVTNADGAAVTLTNGTFTEAGVYNVTYKFALDDGGQQTLTNKVTVNAVA